MILISIYHLIDLVQLSYFYDAFIFC